METSLIDRLLASPDVLVLDDAAVAVARARVREVGADLPREIVETMALVTSELLTNQLRHASGGRFAVRRIQRAGVAGLEVVAVDRGRGLVDPPRALTEKAPPTGTGSLGAGVGAVFRLADEVDVDVRVGEGTCFRVRRFVTSPRYREEIGIFGRPCPGESICGDDAAVSRRGAVTVIAVADGLGHGVDAREAAARAVAAVPVVDDVAGLVEAAQRAVAGTRGATAAFIRHDDESARATHAGLGDVSVRHERGRASTKLAGQSGMIGNRPLERNIRVDDVATEPGDTFIVATDGITSSADGVLSLGRHPLLVAHELVTTHARPNDDALVVVARVR